MLTVNYSVIINIGVILFTLVESYVFPIAIVKWIVIATKCSGVLDVLKGCPTKIPLRNRYSYNLLLTTSRKHSDATTQYVSHVNVLLEDEIHSPGSLERMQLSYCGQDCKKIPAALQKLYGAKTKCLDLSWPGSWMFIYITNKSKSYIKRNTQLLVTPRLINGLPFIITPTNYNTIETLRGLEHFGRLEELILDNNKLGDGVTYPYLPYLRTLSLNNNQITDLEALIEQISERFPSLTYLSLLSNKACPNQLSDFDKDDSDYQRYRYFVVYKMPHLRFLDSRRVFEGERREADVRGEFMRVRRPPPGALDDTHTHPHSHTRARPLPVDLAALGKHKGAYGKCHYKYTGKHSEGNRFIVNSDL